MELGTNWISRGSNGVMSRIKTPRAKAGLLYKDLPRVQASAEKHGSPEQPSDSANLPSWGEQRDIIPSLATIYETCGGPTNKT